MRDSVTGRARLEKDPSFNDLFPVGMSSAAILEEIRAHGPISRADLPDRIQLSQQTVHRLTEELCRNGFAVRGEPIIHGRGKPSPRLTIDPNGAYGIGVAIDTNSVQVFWVDFAGEVQFQRTIDVAPNEPEAVVPAAYEAAMEGQEAIGIPAGRVAGCGVSIQGYRASKAQTYYVSPRLLENWRLFDLEQLFARTFKMPVYCENNARLSAIAELWRGAGRRYPSFVYLSFNYGFGGGVVLNGQPFIGAHAISGEISRLYTLQEMPTRPALSGLIEMLRTHGVDVETMDVLKARFDPNWPGVSEWLDVVTPKLNQMLRAIMALIDPDAVVFGGEAPEALCDLLIERCDPAEIGADNNAIPTPVYVRSEITREPSGMGAGIQAIRRRVLGAS